MTPYSSLCDDFHLCCYLNTEMELPQSRDTVLHYFGQIRKAFPKLVNFYGRDPNEYVLEDDKENGSHRWTTLETRRLTSGFLNPSDLDIVHPQNELMLDLAPHLLSVSPLDCEALDVMFAFDLVYQGNHDEVVGEVFASDSKFSSLIQLPGCRLVDFEPMVTFALDEQCRLQCRLSIVTRTNPYQVRTNQFNEDAISIYFTVRQEWNFEHSMSFVESYRKQYRIAEELVDGHVIPNVVVPLSEVISTR